MASDTRTHPPDCDCAVCEARRGGVDAEGQRLLSEVDRLRSTVPGQRIEEPDPEPAGGGCGCGCWFVILLLAVVIVGAVGYWQGFLPEVIEDRIPFTGGSDNGDSGERDGPDSTVEADTAASTGQPSASRRGSVVDRTILVAFYNATNGDDWTDNTNWLSDAPIDQWYGVAIDAGGRVQSLRLGGNGLSGTVPPEIGRLSNLRELSLSDNRLTGEIPAELGSLPRLASLELSNNQLSGQIPRELASLSGNLTGLDLRGNHLTGCIPDGLRGVPAAFEDLGLPFCRGGAPAAAATPAPGPSSAATPVPAAAATHVPAPSETANLRSPAGNYDTDNDGLIGVFNLEQLNAIRYDLNGDGRVDISSDEEANAEVYAAAYPDAATCRDCNGYELADSLDFDDADSYASGVANSLWISGEGWPPIGDSDRGFGATFEGNGHTISNLHIDLSRNAVGLFGSSTEVIRGVGLVDVDVTGTDNVGGLVGLNRGAIITSYVTGRISGQVAVGGLAGVSRGRIIASHAIGDVSGVENVGGLAGWTDGTVIASYAAASVRGGNGLGGLVGELSEFDGGVTDSYWDTQVSGLLNGVGRGPSEGVEGKTTAELQSPTGYTGIYDDWDLDLDNADLDRIRSTRTDDFWHFGNSRQYPAPRIVDGVTICQESARLTPPPPNRASGRSNGKYDTDGDRLIQVSNLEQLNAIRYDVDGDGAADDSSNDDAYADAFPASRPEAVCDANCNGYELTRSLDFNDSRSYRNDAVNIDWTTGRGWVPIGDEGGHFENFWFNAVFEGNGHTISNLFIHHPGDNRAAKRPAGLFGITGESSVIRDIGLVNAIVGGDFYLDQAGALAGWNRGTIALSHSDGSVSSRHPSGGLVGANSGTIIDSHSNATVGKANAGGLVGNNSGSISGSYATGIVTSEEGMAGGLVAWNRGVIYHSYATGSISGLERAGGLAASNLGEVCNSYASGSVSGPMAGGLVGDNPGEVGYSYATGDVSGAISGGLIGESRGVISASRAEGSVSGLDNVGGLAGFNAGPVIASYATGSVSASGDSVGGLIGRISSGPIIASYATGDVSGKKWVGWLVGHHPNKLKVRVSASYATGDVSGDEAVGGLLGNNGPRGSRIVASYSTGRVSGPDVIGGLVGTNSGDIIMSYSSGRVTGIDVAGGLVGQHTGIALDARWDPAASGQDSPVGSGDLEVRGVRTGSISEFRSAAGYTGIYGGWDIDLDNADGDGNPMTGVDDFWEFGTSRGYPVLKVDFDGDGVATWQEFGNQLD